MFAYRHRVAAGDPAAHAGCHEGEPMKVAITGASGLVGSALVPFLTTGGHEVLRLVRRTPKGTDEARWDPEAGEIDAAALEGVDAVVHLAGENIAGARWTEARKALLRSSRVGPTAAPRRSARGTEEEAEGARLGLRDRLLREPGRRVGDRDGRARRRLPRPPLDEWEAAAGPAREAGIRVVYPRFGIVLSPAGGALGKMLLPFKAGLGGVVGPGTQYMSWIALDDLLGVVHHLLDRADLEGPVNVVAPAPVTNAVFTKTLGRVLGRPTVASVPAFALRLALGEMADAALLSSTRVRPERLQASGYRFRFPELEGALRHVLGRPS